MELGRILCAFLLGLLLGALLRGPAAPEAYVPTPQPRREAWDTTEDGCCL